jgi:hypothetical protein
VPHQTRETAAMFHNRKTNLHPNQWKNQFFPIFSARTIAEAISVEVRGGKPRFKRFGLSAR